MLGEFYYHVTPTSFGPYIDQVGRYPAVGQTGWVFKLNGVSPPVGANEARLKDGDTVLWYWAQFGVAGGPKTLVLQRRGRCYTVLQQDDAGATSRANGAELQVGSQADGPDTKRAGVHRPRTRVCSSEECSVEQSARMLLHEAVSPRPRRRGPRGLWRRRARNRDRLDHP